MFESKHVWRLTQFAYEADFRQKDYLACWEGLQSNFQAKTIA
jgi:homogentisate 1,2-dioxygenase